MLPNQKGSYQARPTRWKVGKSKNGALELAIEFSLFGFWDGAQWCSEESEIDGRFYLISTEGKIVERQVAAVEDVFGWNRASGTQWFLTQETLPDCQVAIDFEEYNGSQKIKVKWLNKFDREPNSGIGSSDPTEVKSLDAQYGGLFRATARGGAPPAPRPAGTPPTQNVLQIAKSKAWQTFQLANPGKSKEEMAQAWKLAIASYFGAAAAESLGARQFDKFAADGFRKEIVMVPDLDEQGIPEDDIPF